MKLTAEIEGGKHELDIKREGVRVVALVDGRRYEMEVSEPERGAYLLLEGGRVFDCRVAKNDPQHEVLEVSVNNRSYAVALANPKRLRGATQPGAHADGSVQIIAPMPGKVVRVLVEVGTHVEAGAGLVVVEAMKMQNEMKAPRAGTVVALETEAGATVKAGDVLAVIE
ncbi:MAG: biotin/lipoyl-containing protein [Pyrinomonadaceae bacterium]